MTSQISHIFHKRAPPPRRASEPSLRGNPDPTPVPGIAHTGDREVFVTGIEARRTTRRLAVLLVALGFTPPGNAALGQRAQRPGTLISVPALAAQLDDPDLVLLHVGDRKGYDAEHIPGARFINLRDLSTPNPKSMADGLMLELPAPAVLRATLARLGISDGSRIVVYYATDWVSPATRVVFTLDYLGLGRQTALLDGGMGAWKAAGKAVTAVPASVPSPGHLSARDTRPVVADLTWVQKHRRDPHVLLVDARAPVYYEGLEASMGTRPGHIPGARNIPFSTVVNDSLYWKTPAQLRSLFQDAGAVPGDTILAYCHIGEQATTIVFAARTLGYPALLYDGSFTEWGRHPDLPVVTGRDPGGD